MNACRVNLFFGVIPAPAPRRLAEAFESLTVTISDSGLSSGWQLVLRGERRPTPADDDGLVAHPLLKPFTRVIASVTLGAADTVLLDGVITHVELSPVQDGKGALVTVTGDALDTLMDLHDFTIPWPAMTEALIAEAVLAKYAALGILPEVVPPVPPAEIPDPLEGTIVQNETDAAFLRRLGCSYGFLFFVVPGPRVGLNTAYWGPPPRWKAPQKALSVDMGEATNVNAMSFAYDAKGPTWVFGSVQSTELDMTIPVTTTVPTRLPPLSSRPAIVDLLPFIKYDLYSNPAAEPGRAFYEANATTQQSTDAVVTVQGSLDTVRYDHVLEAPGVVDVRGAGATYDGHYYVQSVTHTLRLGTYTQDFVLTREGAGTTTTKVVP